MTPRRSDRRPRSTRLSSGRSRSAGARSYARRILRLIDSVVARLEDLDTPCLVLDRTRVGANALRLRKHLTSLGVPLRLHVKTAKCPEVAALVLGGEKAPITVSTLKEAEQVFDGGYRD